MLAACELGRRLYAAPQARCRTSPFVPGVVRSGAGGRLTVNDAIRQRFGEVAPTVARGIALRHDWGPQYTSGYFRGALRWLGIKASTAFAGEPPCNGCVERFIRTLNEQWLWARTYADLDYLRTAVRAFVERYNTQWLIERHGHRTPRETYALATQVVAA